LLPYLGQPALWDRAQNAYRQERSFQVRPPHCGDFVVSGFLCPSGVKRYYGSEGRKVKAASTYYLGVEGTDQASRDGTLFLDSRIKAIEISDGLSHTLLIGERPPSADGVLGWWYAGWGQDQDGSAEMVLGAREQSVHSSLINCPDGANRYRQGRSDEQCDALHFWSVHFSGAHFLFADGSVHFLSYTADKILPALATRAGQEAGELP